MSCNVLAAYSDEEIGFVELMIGSRGDIGIIANDPEDQNLLRGEHVKLEPLVPMRWSLGRPVFLKVVKS